MRLANAQQQKDWNEEMCFKWQQKVKQQHQPSSERINRHTQNRRSEW